MFKIRVTGPSGVTSHGWTGAVCTVGRDQSNDVVIPGSAASSRHCQFEQTQSGCTLRDVGSSNGTYVNGQRISAVVPINQNDRIYVGSFLLELVKDAPVAARPSARLDTPAGPILRTPGPHRVWRDQLGRLTRYAAAWEKKMRPASLALKGSELDKAERWLKQAPPELSSEITRSHREFIAESRKVAKTSLLKRVFAIAGGVVVAGAAVTAAVIYWPEPDVEDAPIDQAASDDSGGETDAEPDGGFEEIEDDRGEDLEDGEDPDAIVGEVDAEIVHVSIPFETLSDVARRYGVSVDEIAAANFLNPDDPSLPEGTKIEIQDPKSRPLPQQKITYEIEAGEAGWTRLAKRFEVPATRLETYNPGIEPTVGQKVTVWIDPKPYAPREPRKPVPEFTVDKSAVSVGWPNKGKLLNGIQMPEMPELYTLRKPYIMWGSANMVANLQKAVATFRADVDFEGIVILADMSQQHGGKFKPHKSHQAGRDIDIWLPTLKGVYKRKYLGEGKTRPRKPHLEEVDWYATWGLVRALIQTGAVKEVFLDWRYQEYVYRAAVNMGATDEELDEWIQWPRSKGSPKGVFRHSKDHLSHIHVRFKCAEWEDQCRKGTAR